MQFVAVSVAIVLLAGVLHFASAKEGTHSQHKKFFETFLEHVVARDAQKLASYFESPACCLVDGELDEAAYALAYGPGGAARGLDHPWIPIVEILGLGPYSVEVKIDSPSYVLFVVVPDIYAHETESKDFWYDQFMIKYFACDFDFKDGRYVLSTMFCFSETGGPWHDYG